MKKLVKKVAILVAAIAITAGSFAPLANAAPTGGGQEEFDPCAGYEEGQHQCSWTGTFGLCQDVYECLILCAPYDCN